MSRRKINLQDKKSLKNILDASVNSPTAKAAKTGQLLMQGRVNRDILELIYQPNQIVIYDPRNNDTEPAAYVVKSFVAGSLTMWSWAFDGNTFIRRERHIDVTLRHLETVATTELVCFPLDHSSNDLVKKLRFRGNKFWNHRRRKVVAYRELHTESKPGNFGSRFIVDTLTYARFHPGGLRLGPVSTPLRIDLFPQKLRLDDEPSDKMMLMMPSITNGFNLLTKRWESLLVEQLEEPNWNQHAYSRLILPPKIKDLVRSMVLTQDQANGQEDFIKGKGDALVMLLHGSPGTGKTLTAGYVAELAKRPLYRVTCGDIGTDADAVEKYLESVLYLGKIWNCVLLFDEADVFLEERSLTDLHRNSLVSVFLRVLEYYEGIIILTSNRVGTFDEAFKSRIQLAIHYPELTRLSRRQIWENFFHMLSDDDFKSSLDELHERLDELAEKPMNGRQIRNAITAAKRLSLARREALKFDHIMHVIDVASDFDKYIEKVHGHSDADHARHEKTR